MLEGDEDMVELVMTEDAEGTDVVEPASEEDELLTVEDLDILELDELDDNVEGLPDPSLTYSWDKLNLFPAPQN